MWHLFLHGRSAEQRAEIVDWLDGEVEVPERWQVWIDSHLDADEIARREDDRLLAALGLTREQVEREVASRE